MFSSVPDTSGKSQRSRRSPGDAQAAAWAPALSLPVGSSSWVFVHHFRLKGFLQILSKLNTRTHCKVRGKPQGGKRETTQAHSAANVQRQDRGRQSRQASVCAQGRGGTEPVPVGPPPSSEEARCLRQQSTTESQGPSFKERTRTPNFTSTSLHHLCMDPQTQSTGLTLLTLPFELFLILHRIYFK